jgi:hypothetical protein
VGEEWIQPQAPEPDMVTAARRHLSSEFAQGVDRLLWDLEKRPMPDLDAVNAVIGAARRSDRPVEALSIGAALVLLQSLRLELDVLEADVFGAALESGVGYDSLAAVLDLPDPDAAQTRERYLKVRRELPRAPAPAPPRHGPLSYGPAAATASEARVQAGDAAERVATGLLRAAIALDRCAARCEELRQSSGDPTFTQRAQEYSRAAQRYREMAESYTNIGKGM